MHNITICIETAFDFLDMQLNACLKLFWHVWRQACVIAYLSVKGLHVFRREGYLYPVVIQLSKWYRFPSTFLAADPLPQIRFYYQIY